MPEDVEQLIEVPKILPDFIPRRAVLQEPQTADQLVDVPQISPEDCAGHSSIFGEEAEAPRWSMADAGFNSASWSRSSRLRARTQFRSASWG